MACNSPCPKCLINLPVDGAGGGGVGLGGEGCNSS